MNDLQASAVWLQDDWRGGGL